VGGLAGRNRVAGGQAPWPAAVASPERAVRAYGPPNDHRGHPRARGKKGGSCTGREDGRRGKPGRGRHGRRHGAHGARGLGAISHETRNETHGEREGTTASSPRAKIGGGDGSETAARAEVDGEIRRPRNDGCWGLRCVSGAKLERGSRGARGGARLPFNKAEGHEGGAPTTPGR